MYAPWLKGLHFNTCCRLRYGIELYESFTSASGIGLDYYEIVIITRPDLMIKPDAGHNFISSLVTRSAKAITWPFRCEDLAWDLFGCVADTFTGMPADLFEAYKTSCIGRSGCNPDAFGDLYFPRFFDDLGLEGTDTAVDTSGHACYRCVVAANKRWQSWPYNHDRSHLENTKFKAKSSQECKEDWSSASPEDCEKSCVLSPFHRCEAWTLDRSVNPTTCCHFGYTSGTEPAENQVRSVHFYSFFLGT